MPGSEPGIRQDSPLFTELCSELLSSGRAVRFRVRGESMRPNLLDGDDVLVAPTKIAELRRGDVVLTRGENGLKVHRVARVDTSAAQVITRGDSGIEDDVSTGHILGRIIAAERHGRTSATEGSTARLQHSWQRRWHQLKRSCVRRLKQVRSVATLSLLLFAFAGFFQVSSASAQSLTITNSASPAYVLPGGTITYTQVLSNTSGVTVTANITVTQSGAGLTFVSATTSGSGTWSCTATTCTETAAYPSGSSTTLTITATLNTGGNTGTPTTETATAKGKNTTSNATASATITSAADLALTQTVSSSQVAPGANYNYVETVKNNNNITVPTGTITLSTTTPANTTFQSAIGTSWTCGTVPAVGGTGTITCTYNASLGNAATSNALTITLQVVPGTASGTVITNSATAAVTGFTDPNSSNNTASNSITVQAPDLALTQTVSSPDVAPGGNYTYTEVVTNNGPANVGSGTISVSMTTPPNTTFQSATGTNWTIPCTAPPVGGTGTITCTYNSTLNSGVSASALMITLQVAAGTAVGTVITNTATVADSAFIDPTPSNNTASNSVTVEPAGTADLQLTQTASASAVAAGANYSYTEIVVNNGPANAATGTITVYLQTPANTNYRSYAGTNWTCTAPAAGGTGPVICTYNGALNAGATASTLTLTFQVNAGTTAGTTIQSSATVTNSTLTDPIPTNNTSITSIVVEPTSTSDLGISMSVYPTPVFVSSNFTYNITVQNFGQLSAPITSNVLSDALPAGVTYVSYTASSSDASVWTCSGTTTISCSITSSAMTVGAVATISITVTAPSSATTLSNTASVSLTGDPNGANNSATTYTVVQPLACATPGRDGAGGTLTGIVNTYYPPTASGTLASASTSVTLGAAQGATTPIAIGDLLLIIQMQGASINSTNTSSYGDGIPGDPGSGSTNPGSSGLFEFITATTAVPLTGGTLSFTATGPTGGLLNSYSYLAATTTAAQQTYQVIRVPQYTSATLGSGLVPLAWNGSLGGVLALDISSQLTLGGTVALDALGFRGGGGQLLTGPSVGGNNTPTDYVTGAPASNTTTTGANGSKGEGIAGTPRYIAPSTIALTTRPTDAYGGTLTDSLPGGSSARGAPGNAGGGGTDGDPPANDQNSGGGAGGNGGTGGQGGYGWNSMAATNTTDGGFGGAAFSASTSALVMGGGGGAGTTNNGSYFISGTSHNANCGANCTGIYSSGGAGGGIVIIHAGSVTGTGTITSNGGSTLSTDNDSTGGGGAGGSILVFANSGDLSGLTAKAVGGSGGDAWPETAPGGFPGQRHGPGGGGGGGVIFLTAAPVSSNVAGGSNGFTNTVQDSYGSTPGQAGTVVTTHVITETPGTQSGAYCGSADLSVTNSGAPTVVQPGGNITYTQTVANAGPLDAVNLVFSEAIPANTTFQSLSAPSGWSCNSIPVGGTGTISCKIATFAANASGTFTVVVQVAGATPLGTQIIDVDNITSGSFDPNLNNNSAIAINAVTSASQADLAVTNIVSAPTVAASSNFTMTSVVTNNGPATAPNVGFTENTANNGGASPTVNATFVSISAPGWTCYTPAVGASGTITCTLSSLNAGTSAGTITITEAAPSGPAGTVLSGTADVASLVTDPNYGNNSATASTVIAGAGQVDLAVSSSGSPNPVTAGNNITYTQSVTNNGPTAITASATTTVTFTDMIPTDTTLAAPFTHPAGWTCNSIAAGSTGTFTCTLNSGQTLAVGAIVNFPLVVKVNAGTVGGTTITNSPNISSSVSDPNTTNNTATVTTIVASPTQSFVTISKTASPDPVDQGTTLTYTILVTNNGPAVAQGVTVTDPIPAEVTYASSSSSQGSCTYSSGTNTVTCSLGTLTVGSAATISINVTATVFSSNWVTCNGITKTYNSCNTATVTSTTSNPNPNTSSSAGSTIAAPTAVDLTSFSAFHQSDGSVRLVWRTHEESRNLGFHIYREDSNGRHRINPSLIAGSALLLRGSKPQHAAKSYAWVDSQPVPNAAYWIEDVDINGTRTVHGPAYPQFAIGAENQPLNTLRAAEATAVSPALAQLRSNAVPSNLGGRRPMTPPPSRPRPLPQPPPFNIADHPAVKISVEQEGWYHLTFAQLFAAGLEANTDVRFLHLYAEGIEQPLLLIGHNSGIPAPTDAIEFYGSGIDTPFSGTRVYWLVRENSFGKRVLSAPATSSNGTAPSNFSFTVMREDRTTYFAALLNGENNDNFFGDVITSTPVDEILDVVHRDASSSEPPTLDLALQGGTDQQLHTVSVQFNGSNIGTFDFYGLNLATQSFSVDPSLLLDGANDITLTALNGDNDVSLVQSAQLHYPHTYVADADWLRATANAGSEVHISGFSSSLVRLFDITDPLDITELNGNVVSDSGTYRITATVSSAAPYTRTLLAFSDAALSAPSALSAYTPSFLDDQRVGADIIIITHPDFAAHLAPVVRLRSSQGYKVLQVTTDQIFDDFNYGERSPFAIRSFLQDAATHWQRKPQAIVLVGDASMDPRNYLGFGDFDFVPTRIIETAAFKTASDDWFTDFQQSGFGTIPIGRLPVRTSADIDLLVSKIIAYEQGQSSGTWNAQALLIADQNISANFSAAVTSAAASLPQSLETSQILADGLDTTTARTQIIGALNQGALLVDYNGHGAEQQWSFSDLFDNNDAAALTNGGRLPVYLLIDCLNGLFQDVYAQSLAESLLLAPNGGAVGVWASSGFTEQSPQTSMDLALLHELSAHPNELLGLMILHAKSGTTDNDVRRTWNFLGDPAMKLHFAGSSSAQQRTAPNPPPRIIPPRRCARGVVCAMEK